MVKRVVREIAGVPDALLKHFSRLGGRATCDAARGAPVRTCAGSRRRVH
ncbi:hypothetical protein BH10ACT10_BH10ACT10_00270 [soil metagenome]